MSINVAEAHRTHINLVLTGYNVVVLLPPSQEVHELLQCFMAIPSSSVSPYPKSSIHAAVSTPYLQFGVLKWIAV